MRISFVIPNLAGGKHFLQPPLDALYSLAYLKHHGHECTLLDNRVKRHNFDELAKNIPESDVIIATTAPYDLAQMYHFDYRLSYSIATINRIKQAFPETPLILTGIHANVRPDLLMRDSKADVLLLGEFEQSLPGLVAAIEDGIGLKNISNLWFRENESIVTTKEDGNRAHPSLEVLLMPDYSAIDFNDYYGYELSGDRFKRAYNWGVVLGSRGCPNKCKFCHNFWGNEVRYRSADSVVEELEAMEKKHGARHIFFLDPNFTLDREWAKSVCEGIKSRGLTLKWGVQTRFDLVDDEVMNELAYAGCSSIFYGLESYNDSTLARMHKGINTKAIDSAVKLTKKHGIMPVMFIMLGLPGETKEGLRKTISFLMNNELPYIPIVYGPRFGTEFEREYEMTSGRHLEWNDLSALKGKIGNEIGTMYLAKVVRFLRQRNVLTQGIPAGGIL